jgi:hypothetical protein
VGSRAYARDEAALGTPIIAVFQMDMIGYDVHFRDGFHYHVRKTLNWTWTRQHDPGSHFAAV